MKIVSKELTGKVSLVELNNQYASLAARITELGGELTPETETELESLVDQLCEKADGYGVVLRQLENNVEFWKVQKLECAAAQKVYENAIENLRSRMKYVLGLTEGEALQGDLFRFYLARTTPSLIIDDNLLPAKYKKTELVVTPDRSAIKVEIDQGHEVPGVTVQENKSLRTGRPK